MDRLIYTALAGINERRPQRQVEANDLANVSTVGFKKSFDQALIAIKTRGDGYDTRIQPQSRTTDRINLEPGARMVTNKVFCRCFTESTNHLAESSFCLINITASL